jgi:hypothetical protein
LGEIQLQSFVVLKRAVYRDISATTMRCVSKYLYSRPISSNSVYHSWAVHARLIGVCLLGVPRQGLRGSLLTHAPGSRSFLPAGLGKARVPVWPRAQSCHCDSLQTSPATRRLIGSRDGTYAEGKVDRCLSARCSPLGSSGVSANPRAGIDEFSSSWHWWPGRHGTLSSKRSASSIKLGEIQFQ